MNVSAAPQYNNSVLHNSSMAMFDVFIWHLYCFKHRGFREEPEWRLVETLKPVSGASKLHYRTSGTLTNAPYVIENLGLAGPSGNKLPIAEIYCGARCPPGLGEKYLINWLSAHGYYPLPTITASKIPLRSAYSFHGLQYRCLRFRRPSFCYAADGFDSRAGSLP